MRLWECAMKNNWYEWIRISFTNATHYPRPISSSLAKPASANKMLVHTLFRKILIENIPFDRLCKAFIHGYAFCLLPTYCQTFHIFHRYYYIFFSFEFLSIWCFIIILQRAIFAIPFFITFYFSISSHSTCPGIERWLFNFSRRLLNGFIPNDRWMIDAIHFIIVSWRNRSGSLISFHCLKYRFHYVKCANDTTDRWPEQLKATSCTQYIHYSFLNGLQWCKRQTLNIKYCHSWPALITFMWHSTHSIDMGLLQVILHLISFVWWWIVIKEKLVRN